MGPVFRALDPDTDRLVAIKTFKLDLVPEQAAALAAELRTLVAPSATPGVIAVVGAGIAGLTPFLALEYATGDPLDVVLRQSGAPSPVQAVEFCQAMARAIDAAWARRVGHGALHPRDVFIGGAPSDVAMTGFGVAQALETAGVKAPVRRPYAAPERVAGEPWDRRADVYALAAMVRESLRATPSGVPPAVQAVLNRGLAEHPDDRFATATSLADALTIAVSEAPSAAPPEAVAATITLAPVREVKDEDDGVGLKPLGLELSDKADELPLRTASQAPAAVLMEAHATFPWGAIAAVALAGVAVGGVAGYAIGVSRAPDGSVASAAPGPQITPAPAAADVAQSVEPAPAPLAAPVMPGPRPTPADPAASVTPGSLTVDSRPRGARVTVDGRVFGRTPLRVPEVSPGDHRVLIELAGHRRVVSTVRVIAGEPAQLKVTLEQSIGVLGKNR